MCGQDKPNPTTYVTPDCLKPVEKSQAKDGDLVIEEFPITVDGYNYKWGRIAYIVGRGPVPVILVHHNYAGLNQFDMDQACFLAKAGYVGLAVDLYKETEQYNYEDRNLNTGRIVDFEGWCKVIRAENPLEKPPPAEYTDEEMQGYWDNTPKDDEGKVHYQGTRHFVGGFAAMMRLLKGPDLWRRIMAAFLEKAFEHPAVLSGCAGAIGYCLGGQSCLEMLRAGHQVQAICSFHGLLHSRPTTPEEPFNSQKRISAEEYKAQFAVPNTYTENCRVLIENGAHDGEVPPDNIVDWMAEMDEHNVDWRFVNHARGPHGFALAKGTPGAGVVEHIDRRSSIDMFSLFAETWPTVKQFPVECNACGTRLGQLIVSTAGESSSESGYPK